MQQFTLPAHTHTYTHTHTHTPAHPRTPTHTDTDAHFASTAVDTRADAQASQPHKSWAQHCAASKETAAAAAGDGSHTPVNRKRCAQWPVLSANLCARFNCNLGPWGGNRRWQNSASRGVEAVHARCFIYNNTQHIKMSQNTHRRRCGAMHRPTWPAVLDTMSDVYNAST